jgi:hypothetical protein
VEDKLGEFKEIRLQFWVRIRICLCSHDQTKGFIFIITTPIIMVGNQGGSPIRLLELWGKGEEDAEQHRFLVKLDVDLRGP